MKVLVACEFSGIVREAFRARGHDAWSCDLLDSEKPSDFHWKGDVTNLLKHDWDLIIAHPPCTYLANAGLHYLKTRPERKQCLEAAFEFVKTIWGAPAKKVCIENPTGWLNTHWMRPHQIIQPYFFGTPEFKTTCLWLKGLPPLMATNVCDKPKPKGFVIRKTGKVGKKYNYHWRESKTAHHRSRTFQCIADAMAQQWG